MQNLTSYTTTSTWRGTLGRTSVPQAVIIHSFVMVMHTLTYEVGKLKSTRQACQMLKHNSHLENIHIYQHTHKTELTRHTMYI
jgi:hypothetical protein